MAALTKDEIDQLTKSARDEGVAEETIQRFTLLADAFCGPAETDKGEPDPKGQLMLILRVALATLYEGRLEVARKTIAALTERVKVLDAQILSANKELGDVAAALKP